VQTLREIKLCIIAVLAAGSGFPAADSLAQDYPVKPIRMLVGFSAGGSTDVGARMVAQKMTEYLQQSVIVENRTGAGGAIANARAATSPPDGYTLLMLSASATILPALRKLSYDVERDLAPVSLVAAGPLVLVVHPSVPARNVKELVALARSTPSTLTYGTNGAGSTAHLSGELFQSLGKVKLLHVPYKGVSEAVTATAGGNVDINFPTIPPAQALLAAGKIRALAVTSAKRASLMPSTPTISESGLPGYEYGTWFGVVAPARVPKDIIAQLHTLVVEIVNSPEVRALFIKQGLEPKTNTPEEFAAHIRREVAKNAKLIQAAGVTVE